MKKITALLVIAVIVFSACKKDSSQNHSNDICTVATVEYGGDPAADGLGWILVTDTVTRKFEAPEDIPAAFKVHGLLVDVCYVRTDKDFICFCAPPPQKIVRITSIVKH
jgi:hypothetical protein